MSSNAVPDTSVPPQAAPSAESKPADSVETKTAVEAAGQTIAAATTDESDIDPPVRAMMRQMLSDSMIIAPYQVFNYIMHDTEFREMVIRYLYKVHANQEPAAVFHQGCVERKWSTIEKLSVNDKKTRMYMPHLAKLAQQLVDDKNRDCVVLCVDYVHPAARYMNLRYSCLLTLAVNEKVEKDRPKNMSVQNYIKMKIENSQLFEEHVVFQPISMMASKRNAQKLLDEMKQSILEERGRISTGFANAFFVRDIREVCLQLNIHEDVIKEDDAATDGKLPRTRCFRIQTGLFGVPPRCADLTHDTLARFSDKTLPESKDHPLRPTYEQALQLVQQQRQKYEAVCIVIRAHDGPLSTMSTTNVLLVNMQHVGYDVEQQRKARAALAAQFENEYATTLAQFE